MNFILCDNIVIIIIDDDAAAVVEVAAVNKLNIKLHICFER